MSGYVPVSHLYNLKTDFHGGLIPSIWFAKICRAHVRHAMKLLNFVAQQIYLSDIASCPTVDESSY